MAQILSAVEVVERKRPMVTPTKTYCLFCAGSKLSSCTVMTARTAARTAAAAAAMVGPRSGEKFGWICAR